MLATEFVQGYPRTPSLPYRLKELSEVGQEAYRRSWAFGVLTHDILSGVDISEDVMAGALDGYDAWVDEEFTPYQRVLETEDVDWRTRNELNFHALNRHMLHMWGPLLDSGWGSDARRHAITNAAQNYVAYDGAIYYEAREAFTKERAPDFYDALKEISDRYTGMLQEYDVAITALDMVHRNPHLTVVPSPWQFEHSQDASKNVDLLVVDMVGQRAVGIQVKTSVRHRDGKPFDPDRVVPIDGCVDLDNVRALRTKKHKSDKQVKPWPGIVSAKRMSAMQIPRNYPPTDATLIKKMYGHKRMATELMRGVKYDSQEVCQRVGTRVLAKL